MLPDRPFVKAMCSRMWACGNTGRCLGKWFTEYSHASVKNPWNAGCGSMCLLQQDGRQRPETPWKLIGQLSGRPCVNKVESGD